MKIDLFEGIFPGLAVYDDETNQLVVSLDDHCFIVQGARNENGIDWWGVLPANFIEQNAYCLGFCEPSPYFLFDMIRGAELITDPESAKIAVRDWVYEEIWSKARKNKSLIKDDAQPSL